MLYSSFQCVEEVLGYLKSCFSREPMMATVCVQQVSIISCPLGFVLTLSGEATKLSSVLEAGAYCVILGRVGCHSCLLCDWDCEGAEGIRSSTGPHCFACVCYLIYPSGPISKMFILLRIIENPWHSDTTWWESSDV